MKNPKLTCRKNFIFLADDVEEAAGTGASAASAAAAATETKDPATETAAATESEDDGEDFALLGALFSHPKMIVFLMHFLFIHQLTSLEMA